MRPWVILVWLRILVDWQYHTLGVSGQLVGSSVSYGTNCWLIKSGDITFLNHELLYIIIETQSSGQLGTFPAWTDRESDLGRPYIRASVRNTYRRDKPIRRPVLRQARSRNRS